MIAVFGRLGLRHRGGIAVKRRIVLVCFAVHKAVEVLESPSPAGGPAIEWTSRADLGVRRVVPLSESRCRITVLAENFWKGSGRTGNDAGVAGIASPHLDDDTRADTVVIAPCQECSPCGRTEGCRVECGVAKTFGGESVHGGRAHRAAEGACMAEPNVVKQDY
jgi:hypothetical protein